jgi:hypothetical protein
VARRRWFDWVFRRKIALIEVRIHVLCTVFVGVIRPVWDMPLLGFVYARYDSVCTVL